MGMSSDVELKVRAFKDGAKKRVQAIDLSEYNLVNWNDNGTLLICKDSDMAAGRNDFAELMEKIAEALQDEGMAYLIESVEEDVPFATTYYYQGNDVKTKQFESDPYDGMEMDEEFDDPWEALDAAKEKRHESYIPKAEWADEEGLTETEKELLEKYPW